jgi:hypothetical protein
MAIAPHASRNGGAAARKPQIAPMFVVEGRIGGRWWVWQRFRVRDEGARELAALAAEKRFDGVRMVQTIPGGPGASTTSRELVVVDGNGVHGPGRAEHAPQAESPAPARAPMPQRGGGPRFRRGRRTGASPPPRFSRRKWRATRPTTTSRRRRPTTASASRRS